MNDARCRIELLGEMRVLQSDRVITRFRTQKAAALLAYLALNLNRSHAREQLIDLFWPDMEMEAGRVNLSSILTSLRRQLEPPGVQAGSLLIADRQNVRLNPAAVQTDVAEFDHLLDSAAQTNDPAERAGLLERAVAIYRGELLPGRYDDWAVQEQARCSQRYADALQQWSAALEDVGELEAALTAAQRAIKADPYREQAYENQMRLCAVLGRPVSALETYRELERFLQAELGALPQAATRALAEQVRRDPKGMARREEKPKSPGTQPGPPPERTAPPALSAAPTVQLPFQITRFFGREETLTRLTRLLVSERPPLLTLTGPGGVGKTRLAIEAARQVAEAFGGRVWFVSLADLPDPSLLPFALVSALKLPSVANTDPLERVMEVLSEAPCLLLLDNFEHLLRASSGAKGEQVRMSGGIALVRMLLERAPGLTCLATSRQALHLGGEQEFPIPPLALPDERMEPEALLQCESVALYTDRAQLAKPDFAVTTRNAEAVAALCRKLEGAPLAIEMAAAWAKTLPPARMLERMERQLDLLESRRRDLPPRHQSLRATIEWSYDLLESQLQPFFAALSVFRGGWTLEAVEALCGESALASLSALQERSLVVVEELGEEPRYRLLETLREYAAEKLAEAGETERVRRAHTGIYVRYAENANEHVHTKEVGVWRERLHRDLENIRAALLWCLEDSLATESAAGSQERAETGLRLVGSLGDFWIHGSLTEGRLWIQKALLYAGESGDKSLRAQALVIAGQLADYQGDFAAAKSVLAEGLVLAQEIGDQDKVIRILLSQAGIALRGGDRTAARTRYERCLELGRSEERPTPQPLIWALIDLAMLNFLDADLESACTLLEEALAISRKAEFLDGVILSQINLSTLHAERGEADKGQLYVSEALRLCHAGGSSKFMPAAIESAGRVAGVRGEYGRAVRCYGAAEVRRESLGTVHSADDCQSLERHLEAAQTQLGREGFAVAWSEGRAMTAEQAVEYALGDASG